MNSPTSRPPHRDELIGTLPSGLEVRALTTAAGSLVVLADGLYQHPCQDHATARVLAQHVLTYGTRTLSWRKFGTSILKSIPYMEGRRRRKAEARTLRN